MTDQHAQPDKKISQLDDVATCANFVLGMYITITIALITWSRNAGGDPSLAEELTRQATFLLKLLVVLLVPIEFLRRMGWFDFGPVAPWQRGIILGGYGLILMVALYALATAVLTQLALQKLDTDPKWLAEKARSDCFARRLTAVTEAGEKLSAAYALKSDCIRSMPKQGGDRPVRTCLKEIASVERFEHEYDLAMARDCPKIDMPVEKSPR